MAWKPKNVQNTAVEPSWGQLWRETRCSIWGHQFYVGAGGYYRGMPQSHCWICGRHYQMKGWEPPLSADR